MLVTERIYLKFMLEVYANRCLCNLILVRIRQMLTPSLRVDRIEFLPKTV